jgi:hypothetical protein
MERAEGGKPGEKEQREGKGWKNLIFGRPRERERERERERRRRRRRGGGRRRPT